MKNKLLLTACLAVNFIMSAALPAYALIEATPEPEVIETPSPEPTVEVTPEPSPGPEANPLTVDGTGTLQDSATDKDGKEFYTITTEAGNVFFLIVDHEKEDNNVYFLNAVTEADLAEKASEASTQSNALAERVKELDNALAANANLQKHIVNYSKTRVTFADYRKAGYSKKFKAEHEADILLHQATKKAFDELGFGREKKLPTMKELRAEYTENLFEKKKVFAQYKQSRTDMRELLNAKSNVDVLLGIDSKSPNGRSKHIQPEQDL